MTKVVRFQDCLSHTLSRTCCCGSITTRFPVAGIPRRPIRVPPLVIDRQSHAWQPACVLTYRAGPRCVLGGGATTRRVGTDARTHRQPLLLASTSSLGGGATHGGKGRARQQWCSAINGLNQNRTAAADRRSTASSLFYCADDWLAVVAACCRNNYSMSRGVILSFSPYYQQWCSDPQC